MGNKQYGREQGGLIFEAALILPLIFLCCWLLFSATVATQTDQLVRYAGEQVTSELALMLPVIDTIATESEVLPDKFFRDLLRATHSDSIYRELSDLASSVVLGSHINSRIDYWLSTAIAENAGKLPRQKRQVAIDLALEEHHLVMKLSYTVSTPWNEAWRETKFYIPLWTRYDYSELVKDENKSADDNIWSADNFTRGRYFRDQVGANLPFNFPVICKVSGSAVTAMRSIDFTAPGYADILTGEEQLAYEIDRLANFTGATRGDIKVDKVQNRELILIIPRNTPKIYNEAWRERQRALASARGVELKFIERGTSQRYQSKKEE